MNNDNKKTGWVLVGKGPNSVEVPCLVWTDFDSAMAQCKEMLGQPKAGKNNTHSWDLEAPDYSNVETEDDGEQLFANSIFSKLFTHYYDGCGECYRAVLKEVEVGKPFVGWDLD